MPAPLAIGAKPVLTGFLTKAVFLRSQPASELEVRLGYASGRLASGWWLLWLTRMPTPADFEFMGYSQMSGGIPQGHLARPGGRTAEASLAAGGYDLLRLKQKAIADTFRLSGPDRLAKVIPRNGATGPMPYPPGSGIPQWKIVPPGLPFLVVAMIGPGGIYRGSYT